MKVATLIARVLVGLVFFVLGLNPFLHFIPAVLPADLGGQFLNLLFQSHYVLFIGAVQVAGGVLLLTNRYVPPPLQLSSMPCRRQEVTSARDSLALQAPA